MTTPLSAKRELYSDFFTDFTLNPVTGDLARKTNEEAVKESLKNLIFTDRGERLYQHHIGGDITRSLFDNISPAGLIRIREVIKELIATSELRRVNLIGVDVTSTVDDNAIAITIMFNMDHSEDAITLTTVVNRVR